MPQEKKPKYNIDYKVKVLMCISGIINRTKHYFEQIKLQRDSSFQEDINNELILLLAQNGDYNIEFENTKIPTTFCNRLASLITGLPIKYNFKSIDFDCYDRIFDLKLESTMFLLLVLFYYSHNVEYLKKSSRYMIIDKSLKEYNNKMTVFYSYFKQVFRIFKSQNAQYEPLHILNLFKLEISKVADTDITLEILSEIKNRYTENKNYKANVNELIKVKNNKIPFSYKRLIGTNNPLNPIKKISNIGKTKPNQSSLVFHSYTYPVHKHPYSYQQRKQPELVSHQKNVYVSYVQPLNQSASDSAKRKADFFNDSQSQNFIPLSLTASSSSTYPSKIKNTQNYLTQNSTNLHYLPEPPTLNLPEPPALHLAEPPTLNLPEPPALHLPEPPALHLPEPPTLNLPEPPALHLPEPHKLNLPEPPALHLPEPPAALNLSKSSSQNFGNPSIFETNTYSRYPFNNFFDNGN